MHNTTTENNKAIEDSRLHPQKTICCHCMRVTMAVKQCGVSGKYVGNMIPIGNGNGKCRFVERINTCNLSTAATPLMRCVSTAPQTHESLCCSEAVNIQDDERLQRCCGTASWWQLADSWKRLQQLSLPVSKSADAAYCYCYCAPQLLSSSRAAIEWHLPPAAPMWILYGLKGGWCGTDRQTNRRTDRHRTITQTHTIKRPFFWDSPAVA